jgi:hypothetical protein
MSAFSGGPAAPLTYRTTDESSVVSEIAGIFIRRNEGVSHHGRSSEPNPPSPVERDVMQPKRLVEAPLSSELTEEPGCARQLTQLDDPFLGFQ